MFFDDLHLSKLNAAGGATKTVSQWTTSTMCSASVCVEARIVGDRAEIRDTKQSHLKGAQPVISLSARAFDQFQDELLGLLPAGTNGEILVESAEDGWTLFAAPGSGLALRYDRQEISAFLAGVRNGEFRQQTLLAAA